jgi:hypothetical protein
VRCGGCLAPHSSLHRAIIPTPRQQGVDEEETDTGSSRWSWARLLKRVFALDMARCPWCQRGALRIIAAITHGEVIRKILRHLKLAADPPPIALARGGLGSRRLVLGLRSPLSLPVGRAGRPASFQHPQCVLLRPVCITPPQRAMPLFASMEQLEHGLTPPFGSLIRATGVGPY